MLSIRIYNLLDTVILEDKDTVMARMTLRVFNSVVLNETASWGWVTVGEPLFFAILRINH